MAAFSYQAIDESGKLVKGNIEGDSARQVRNVLRDRKLKPIEVEAAKDKRNKENASGGFRLFSPSINLNELALFTRQLSILIQSGVPLDESLSATAKQAKKGNVQSLLLEIRSRVLEGYSLTNALKSLPNVFDPLYIAMVNAGEKSGHLGPVLEKLADYTEKRQDVSRSVKGALAYPAFLLFFAIVVVVGLVVVIMPRMEKVFQRMGEDLPLPTKILMSISDFLGSYYGLALLIALIVFFIFFLRWIRSEKGRPKWHRILLNLPLVGELLRKADTARFANTLSVLMSSGVPLLEGLNVGKDVLSNQVLKSAASNAAGMVKEGSSLRRALENDDEFPVMMVQMIGSGEVSGELEQMLSKAAQNQERELETVIKGSLSMLGPLIVVIMGVLVGMIVMAILLPIFNMANL